MSAPPARIAMLASCVTREALLTGGRPLRSLAANYARISLASLTAPFPGCPGIDPGIVERLDRPAAVRHWLRAELCKTVPHALAEARPDVLLLDLAEERFDLLVLPSGLILNASLDLVESGLLETPALAGARRVPRLSAEAWDLWEAGLARFAALATSLPACRIVLHRFRWARRAQGTAVLPAALAILPGQPIVRAADHDALLGRLQDRFLAVFPGTQVLEAPPELCLADPEHRWGLSPLHFVPAYHRAIAETWHSLEGTLP
ncbi:DUF6270 domain-containing protein [Methylobacterium sp. Leaf399]|uniref:DUF6270 domain-containing protein n=1 Tax=Methylobacterium sp. Leaf399 TaxID=1736364 RepID=UPI0012E3CADF|nr:DUF6270 domain-containing protein [Methylobacterium sp. Leaf399]